VESSGNGEIGKVQKVLRVHRKSVENNITHINYSFIQHVQLVAFNILAM
jgi:hypothetical protein